MLRLSPKVTAKWDVTLNVYGIKPNKLRIAIKINKDKIKAKNLVPSVPTLSFTVLWIVSYINSITDCHLVGTNKLFFIFVKYKK